MLRKTEIKWIQEQARFRGIEPFEKKVWLASPTMHGDEMDYVQEAFDSGWVTTVGENITKLEEEVAEYVGVKSAVALSSGTAALHMAVKLAAEKVYGSTTGINTPGGMGKGGALYGKRVFCSDLTFAATANPIIYEGGEPVFIDVADDDWSMSPEVLEMAFELYQDVKIVIMTHLYGFPGQIQQIKKICEKHRAVLIEDAAESFGAKVWIGEREPDEEDAEKWRQTGSFGDYGVISFNGNKIITGSSGGMLLVNDSYSARKARYWSTQARSVAPWYQHEEVGYNYRMSNVIAGIVRGQLKYLDEHIAKKKAIFDRYQEKFDENIMCMIPVRSGTKPNYWLSCITFESGIMFDEIRSERKYHYRSQHGAASPMEVLDALEAFNAQGRPIWKPMSMQPVFRNYEQITLDGCRRTYDLFDDDIFWIRCNLSRQIYETGLCLPSDIKMTEEEQDQIIDIVYACFNDLSMERLAWV